MTITSTPRWSLGGWCRTVCIRPSAPVRSTNPFGGSLQVKGCDSFLRDGHGASPCERHQPPRPWQRGGPIPLASDRRPVHAVTRRQGEHGCCTDSDKPVAR